MIERIRMGPLLMWWSPVKYLFPAFIAIDVACLLSRGTPWRGVWASTLDWAGGSLLLLGPVVAGVAAWRTVASNSGLGEAIDVEGGGWRAQRTEIFAAVGWVWLAHLVTVLLACGLAVSGGASGSPDPLPLLPQFLVLLLYAAIGLVAGTLVANPLAAPLVSLILLYLVMQFSAGSPGELWVTVGGATASLASEHDNPSVVVAQTLLGAAAAVSVLAIRRPSLGRVQVRTPLALAAIAPTAVIGAWLAGGPAHYLPDTTVPTLSCVGEQPRVCVLPGQASAARALHTLWSREAAILSAAGASRLPVEFDQVDSAIPLPDGHRAFSLEDLRTSEGDVDVVNATFYALVDRGRCLTGGAPPPVAAVDRLQTAAQYLLVAAGVRQQGVADGSDASRVAALPVRVGHAWLAEVVDASADCSFTAIPRPPAS